MLIHSPPPLITTGSRNYQLKCGENITSQTQPQTTIIDITQYIYYTILTCCPIT